MSGDAACGLPVGETVGRGEDALALPASCSRLVTSIVPGGVPGLDGCPGVGTEEVLRAHVPGREAERPGSDRVLFLLGDGGC